MMNYDLLTNILGPLMVKEPQKMSEVNTEDNCGLVKEDEPGFKPIPEFEFPYQQNSGLEIDCIIGGE